MQISIIISIYNKNDILPNTLYSIARQKISFPFEVCIVDDCSDIDPALIIKEFILDAKYNRLTEKTGWNDCIRFERNLYNIDPKSDTIVIIHPDVILTQPFIIEELCKNVCSKTIALAEVVDIPINLELYKNFDIEINNILSDWNTHIRYNKRNIDNSSYSIWTKYSGKDYPSWLFFLGAIKKEDMYLIEYDKNACDATINAKMRSLGFKANILDNLKGIHQRHSLKAFPCPIVNTCNIHCIRKTKHR